MALPVLIRRLLVIFGVAALGSGIWACEKILLGADPADNPEENFELFWNELDRRYSFFTYKGIDWDAVYATYRPQVYAGMSEAALFEVLADMIFLLRDGHSSLSAPFDVARNSEWYLDAPANYNFDVIEREYLGPNYYITGPLLNQWIDSIGYIHYRSFSSNVSNVTLDIVLQRYADAKGLIIDVRHNGGGNTQFAERIAARFASEEVLTQYWLYRDGPAHGDFSEPEAKYLAPHNGLRFEKPVVVLTNRKCFSATNDFVLIMDALPNVTILGDTTGGGGGLPFNAELPNGWQYRFSSTMTLAPDGFNVEHGIPPDIQVEITPEDEAEDVDSIIEAALDVLD